MSLTKVIIWLEDKPEYNKQVEEALENCKYKLILCENLIDFKDQIEAQSVDCVAGFIIDILIKKNNLSDLDMSMVLTTKGNDTGVAILRSYLRKVDNDSHEKAPWKNSPVLILTSLSEMYFNSRYSSIIESEKKCGNHTTWLTKTDEEGSKEGSIKKIESWIKSL